MADNGLPLALWVENVTKTPCSYGGGHIVSYTSRVVVRTPFGLNLAVLAVGDPQPTEEAAHESAIKKWSSQSC